MTAIKFTPDQKKAIETSGRNLLVSAAAGSGKTAVLSERFVHKVLQGIPVETLVVLTFTNAAAKEMTLRIRDRLESLKDDAIILNALESLETAHIRTFDSFALFILRKYGYHLDLSRRVSIGDGVRLKLAGKRILDQLFKSRYETATDAFTDYVKTYEIKDDRELKKQIMFFHTQLALHADFDNRIEQFGNAFFTPDNFEVFFTEYVEHIEALKTLYGETLAALAGNVTSSIAQAYSFEIETMSRAFLEATDYDTLVTQLSHTASLPNSGPVTRALNQAGLEDEKTTFANYRALLKSLLESLKDDLCVKSKEAHRKAFMNSGQHIDIITELIKDYDKHFTQWQIENECMDFATVARMAYRIISENPSVKNDLTRGIHEVMIDEYQDTNSMQEAFIELITENNVYRVGDVKQSIYRFRHAEPELFISKYHHYTASMGGSVIDLHANFRSRKAIIDDLNLVFSAIMDEAVGGVDYTGPHRLSYGNTAYDAAIDHQASYGLTLAMLDIEGNEERMEKYRLKSEELEAFHVAQDIARKVGNLRVYDHKTKKLRQSKYSDFTILSSVATQFDMIRSVFRYHGIPLNVHKSEPFINYHDIAVYRNLVKAIHALRDPDYYEKHFKHCFLSLARCYLFDFDDDAILSQAMGLPRSLPVTSHFAAQPFKAFFETLWTLKKKAATEPLDKLWIRLTETFNLYEKLVRLPQTTHAKARLEYISTLIAQLTTEGFSLSDLAFYFDEILEEELEVEFDTTSQTDGEAVQLMTVHKSKGLEFPIVYLVQCGRSFNRSRMHAYDFDQRLGFLLEHEEEGLNKSFMHTLKGFDDMKDDLSERLRVLYVALSRAREICIVPLVRAETKPLRFTDEGMVEAYDRIHHFKSFRDIFMGLENRLSHAVVNVDVDTIELSDGHRLDPRRKVYDKGIETVKTYVDAPVVERPTVSTSFSTSVSALLTPEQRRHIEMGNTLHHYFEMIDFARDIEPQIETLTQNKEIRETLMTFFTHPTFTALDIIKVYKEWPFMLDEDDETYTGFMDLLVETNDCFVIIDYKLKHIDKAHYVDQLKGYERILSHLTEKPIEGYLYSILEGRFQKVL